ncbi:FMN-dependent NADH-azoreductase [Litoreibacter roseus]|uniref:FMN dependent NADH:quinone oxidoreductase n=1 Tax=Litoreibacter roseus TaxID=2601869 RepID=A0A6N6JCX7_9RHOB|nr:NAD(P)H-dependent oxidoreductase [Litoreibacter roseus]GFE63827.1 FMN-dependent NADH-azoreductase [Litoreibacter roseus]
MPKLLVIDSSPRGPASVSRAMTDRFVANWKSAYPDGEIQRRDLTETGLEFVTGPWLKAYFTPPPEQTDVDKAALALSDTLAREVLNTDEIVIGTPVYNYNVPALLKSWIDHIVRKGMTLGIDGKGLVTNTKATVLLASGGVYTEASPIAHRDIAPQYLRVLLEAIGITDVTIVAGGGAKAVDMGEVSMKGFVDTLAQDIQAAVA